MYVSIIWSKIVSFFAAVKNDAIRAALLLTLIYYTIGDDSTGLELLKYALGMTIAFSLFSHVQRKILFPYLDMKKLMDKASEDPIASSLVFFSVAMILSMLLYVSSAFFRN